MSFIRPLNRFVLLPTLGFSCSVLMFIKAWPNDSNSLSLDDPIIGGDKRKSHQRQPLTLQREDILEKIYDLPLYKKLKNNSEVEHMAQSEGIPSHHRPYHVGQGLLFGPSKLEIDPLIFRDTDDKSLTVFYHLGKGLTNENNKIHKGVLSLLLDEGLCFCGFPSLSSGRGVTAKLSLKFMKDIPADTTVILRAKVTEAKGRKCVIDGTLESVPTRNIFQYLTGQEATKSMVYASANCILVEPKWFKYFRRFHIFE